MQISQWQTLFSGSRTSSTTQTSQQKTAICGSDAQSTTQILQWEEDNSTAEDGDSRIRYAVNNVDITVGQQFAYYIKCALSNMDVANLRIIQIRTQSAKKILVDYDVQNIIDSIVDYHSPPLVWIHKKILCRSIPSINGVSARQVLTKSILQLNKGYLGTQRKNICISQGKHNCKDPNNKLSIILEHHGAKEDFPTALSSISSKQTTIIINIIKSNLTSRNELT